MLRIIGPLQIGQVGEEDPASSSRMKALHALSLQRKIGTGKLVSFLDCLVAKVLNTSNPNFPRYQAVAYVL